jgi:hypothetical protein
MDQIFVPLKTHDRIEEIVPYLNALTRPGMEVVFLVAYRPEVSWMQIQLTAIQGGVEAIGAFQVLAGNASRERQLRWVEEKIRPAYAPLRAKDVTVVIQTYTGSVEKAIASLRDEKPPVVVMPDARFKAVGRTIGRLKNLVRQDRTTHNTAIVCFRSLH